VTINKKKMLGTYLIIRVIRKSFLGRINILDAARALKVDPDVASNLCEKLAKDEPDDYCIVHGQLIGLTYLDQIAEDILEKLEQNGHINSLKISQQFDLPVDIIDSVKL